MLVTLAGAMSTAQLGLSLANMIRKGKVHAISCTGANLEEDIFNLVAHEHCRRAPHYRELSVKDEQTLMSINSVSANQGNSMVPLYLPPDSSSVRSSFV